jgi:phenylalanyl-tRNA synthetase beta chain
MLVSVDWLRELVGPEIWLKATLEEGNPAASQVSAAEKMALSQFLARRLTMAGLEVESVTPAGPPLPGVIVGEVVSVVRHPNADNLTLCRVATGRETLQVVCGAPNVRAGMKTPLATVGATLPGGVEIRKARLRGEDSSGMLCSARELGLSDDASGLLELPTDLPTGQPLAEALALEDVVLGFNLTPNRGDCMSVLGIARETAALAGQALAVPAIPAVAAGSDHTVPVELTPAAGCVRFAARVISGLRPEAQSPLWMRERLRRAGLRPISAVVDVTNYVMLELGQPMHAYDRREVERGIVVRRAREGEVLRLLDGREITMDGSVLVIADRARSLGLAGVMGGDRSGIGDDTTEVLLEVAYFAPEAIAGRARRYGLITDASQRFERGVDPRLQERALERATRLIIDAAGGVAGPLTLTELADELPQRREVRLRPARARAVIGASIDDGAMLRHLSSLGAAATVAPDGLRVVPPSWRFDLAIEEDLIEEVARLHGFDQVPETPQTAAIVVQPSAEGRIDDDRVADLLVARGYHEAITYSFVDPATQALFAADGVALRLSNPIAEDLAEMRQSLWPGLVQALRDNQRRQQPRVRLFEIGRAFRTPHGRLSEIAIIAGLAAGPALPEQWGARSAPADFYDVKGDVEALIGMTGEAAAFRFAAAEHPALHPGQCARLWRGDRPIGWLGRLHPDVEARMDLTYSAIVFEIEAEPLLAARVPQHREASRYPGVRRDLSFIVDEGPTVREILDRVRASAGGLLTELVLFDVYRGAGIPRDHKSLSIGLNLQDISRTLTDEETDAVVARVIADLEGEYNATIRDK